MNPLDIPDFVKGYTDYLGHNYVLNDINDGNLAPYVVADLKAQLSMQSFRQAIHRMMPVNILPKVNDKLTNIYQGSVVREVVGGNDSDAKLLSWYESEMKINRKMNLANGFFNLCKTCLVSPYVYYGKPKLRVIQNDRFIPYSTDKIEPNNPTGFIILAGTKNGEPLYWDYTASTFQVVNGQGEVDMDEMARLGMEDGINSYGALPFVYINQSETCLVPKQDTDVLRIVKLIPIMLTDLNLAAMFQSFTIMYGIDLNANNLEYAPNAVWFLSSDPTIDKKPILGTLKPEVDFAEVLNLIQSQLSMWLGTKGIRASSIGEISKENFASGISKVIDEMDTYEARQEQTVFFKDGENELWNLIFHTMHPYWVQTGQIDNSALFTATAEVQTSFPIQLPMQTRGQVVTDVKAEYEAGFISKKSALKKLNPDLSDKEIDLMMEEIESERSVDIEPTVAEEPNGQS